MGRVWGISARVLRCAGKSGQHDIQAGAKLVVQVDPNCDFPNFSTNHGNQLIIISRLLIVVRRLLRQLDFVNGLFHKRFGLGRLFGPLLPISRGFDRTYVAGLVVLPPPIECVRIHPYKKPIPTASRKSPRNLHGGVKAGVRVDLRFLERPRRKAYGSELDMMAVKCVPAMVQDPSFLLE